MFQDTNEVLYQVFHRTRRLDISWMSGLAEPTEIGKQETVIVLSPVHKQRMNDASEGPVPKLVAQATHLKFFYLVLPAVP